MYMRMLFSSQRIEMLLFFPPTWLPWHWRPKQQKNASLRLCKFIQIFQLLHTMFTENIMLPPGNGARQAFSKKIRLSKRKFASVSPLQVTYQSPTLINIPPFLHPCTLIETFYLFYLFLFAFFSHSQNIKIKLYKRC